jgi:hypothetical protein
MSRSIGDAEFKQYGVIAEPNIVSRELSDRVCAPRRAPQVDLGRRADTYQTYSNLYATAIVFNVLQ